MFIILEVQSTENATSVLSFTYEDGNVAENKYHTILAYAATSSVPMHSAVLMNEMGGVIKKEYYTHRQEVEENEGLAD